MGLGMEAGLGPGTLCLMLTQLPSPRRRQSPPIFGPFLSWPNGWMRHDATWYGGRLQLRRLCVRWGPTTFPKKGSEPPILAQVYCGQTAGWIRMLLGTEVGLGPVDIILDGDPDPRQNGIAPQFSVRVYCGQTAVGCVSGTEVDLSL